MMVDINVTWNTKNIELKYIELVHIEPCALAERAYNKMNIKFFSGITYFYTNYLLYRVSMFVLEGKTASFQMSQLINNWSRYKNIDKDILRKFIKFEAKRLHISESVVCAHFSSANKNNNTLFRCFSTSKTLHKEDKEVLLQYTNIIYTYSNFKK